MWGIRQSLTREAQAERVDAADSLFKRAFWEPYAHVNVSTINQVQGAIANCVCAIVTAKDTFRQSTACWTEPTSRQISWLNCLQLYVMYVRSIQRVLVVL